ncbi:MAG: 3-oxoacid CoA-transferase subunit B [Synergistaceae bacterium]|jgi:3-oxoacid CoA-transferase B subunit|nr:3-oxoacid CoA-transferase subunit B [Synergistaceae bacterium]
MFIFGENEAKVRIARYIAREFMELSRKRNLYVNLGVGIPTMVGDYIEGERVFLQAENGMLGVGPAADTEHADPQLINAGRIMVTETPGCCYFDSATSFGMVRGGHIDATVLGAFEVDQEGNVANWIIPNGKMLGVGGAMDLVSGANRVYIAMQHATSKRRGKLVPKCTLPVTGFAAVDVVVTEYAVFRFIDGKMTLTSKADEITFEELKSVTPAEYSVSEHLDRYVH